MKKILICGGHLTPALALIEQFKKTEAEIIFIGRKHSVEGSKSPSSEFGKIKSLNIKFLPLTTGRFQRKITVHTIPSLAKIPIGFVQSLFYLLTCRPHVVVSFGGYISTPVVVGAWLLGIPSITHEQATKAGIANKINNLMSCEFLSAWQLKEIKNSQVIGNPTRLCVFNKNAKTKQLQQLLKTHKRIIYITGGNLGSHTINRIIFENIDKFQDYALIHQIGMANYKGDHQSASAIKNKSYIALPYIDDEDIGAVLNAAHIVISRSGANTVWELALLKKVSILIPLPFAGAKEQEHNARILEDAGSAVVISQKILTPQLLLSTIKETESNYAKYQKNADNFSQSLKTNSAEILKNIVMKYLNND